MVVAIRSMASWHDAMDDATATVVQQFAIVSLAKHACHANNEGISIALALNRTLAAAPAPRRLLPLPTRMKRLKPSAWNLQQSVAYSFMPSRVALPVFVIYAGQEDHSGQAGCAFHHSQGSGVLSVTPEADSYPFQASVVVMDQDTSGT